MTVFIVMIVSLQIQDWWDNFLTSRHFPMWLGYLPKIMLAVVITLMDEAYFKVAVWLNDKGNDQFSYFRSFNLQNYNEFQNTSL